MTQKFNISHSSSLPLHLQLLDELRHQIKNGQLKPHDRLPGEWELVETLKISRATIQRAWQTAQEEGLIYRVAGKGTFVAEPPPATQRDIIGFLIPEYRGTFAVSMLSGAEKVLRQHGYRVQFASTDRNMAEENRLLQQLQADGAKGCIMVPAHGPNADRILTSSAFDMPVVLMDRPLAGSLLPSVTSNNYAGGWQAMHHLLDLGHQHIIFLARPHLNLWSVAERYRAYQDALHSRNIVPDAAVLIGEDTELSSYEAYLNPDDSDLQPLVELLSQTHRPSAIFAVNDWLALKAQRAINLADLQTPRDVSLIGFDNLDIAQYQTPPLTTIAQDAASMGITAANQLLALLRGQKSPQLIIQIPTQLVIRATTAPPAATS